MWLSSILLYILDK
jgi:hypothetical protein